MAILKRLLLGLLGLLVVLLVVLYLWSESIIARDYPSEARGLITTSRPEALAEGERLARLYGCYRGCHGRDMEGVVFVETPFLDRIVAPNLTRAINRYSPTEWEAIVRQGVKPDGRSVLGMPSASFATLTDQQLAAVTGFIAGYPPQEHDPGNSRYGLMARVMLVLGVVQPAAQEVSATPWSADFSGDPLRLGEYLAQNACSECHGLDLGGQDDFAPPLTVARAYDREAFGRLMAEGIGLGDRDLGLMSEVARRRFSQMTDQEVTALHSYLQRP